MSGSCTGEKRLAPTGGQVGLVHVAVLGEEDIGRLGGTDGETEVADSDVSLDVDENVGWLEVAVNDAGESLSEQIRQGPEAAKPYLREVKWSMADKI